MKRSNQVLWGGTLILLLVIFVTILYLGHFSRDSRDGSLMTPFWSRTIDKMTHQETLTSNGKQKTISHQVEQFDKISTSGFINLRVDLGEHNQVQITTDENLQKHLAVSVENGELHIAPEEHYNLSPDKPINIHIITPQLTELHLGGNTVLRLENIKTDKLILAMGGENEAEISGEINRCIVNLGGQSDIVMSLKNNHSLQVNNAGQGKLALTGESNEFIFNNGGQFNVHANGFTAKTAVISGAGVTHISLRATDQIRFNTFGESTLHYLGNPKIINSAIGDVNIKKESD